MNPDATKSGYLTLRPILSTTCSVLYWQLNFDANQYFENILKVEKYDANRTFAKFRKLVNKDE